MHAKKTECVLVNNRHDLTERLMAADRVVALFYASWCPFCARFLPIFKQYAGLEGLQFIMVQDDGETMADEYSVKVYPTVLFLEKGVVSERLDGQSGLGLSERQMSEFVDACSSYRPSL